VRHGNHPSRGLSRAVTGEQHQASSVLRLVAAAMSPAVPAVEAPLVALGITVALPVPMVVAPPRSSHYPPPASKPRRPRRLMKTAGPQSRPRSKVGVGGAAARWLPEYTHDPFMDSCSPLHRGIFGSALALASSLSLANRRHVSSAFSLYLLCYPDIVASLAWIARHQRSQLHANLSCPTPWDPTNLPDLLFLACIIVFSKAGPPAHLSLCISPTPRNR
jgi:hypothetical protein